MFEHISPERKTGHHSETTVITLHGLETIYNAQVMIKNSGNLHMVPTASGMNLLAPPKIGKIDQYSFHIVCMLEYNYFRRVCYMLSALSMMLRFFLFVCLFVWFLLSHSRYTLAYVHLLYYLLCLFNPYFSVFHVFSVCELSYISNIYIICVENNSKISRFI